MVAKGCCGTYTTPVTYRGSMPRLGNYHRSNPNERGGALTFFLPSESKWQEGSMYKSSLFAVIAVCLVFGSHWTHGQTNSDAGQGRIQLQFNTDEADAVLAILDKRSAGTTLADSDWQRLFSSEPYLRLKKREASMHRDFTDDDFKK